MGQKHTGWGGGILQGDKLMWTNLEAQAYQTFPSILRMRCAKMTGTIQDPPGSNSDHPLGSNSQGPYTKLSFTSKDQIQIDPLLILALPKNIPLK